MPTPAPHNPKPSKNAPPPLRLARPSVSSKLAINHNPFDNDAVRAWLVERIATRAAKRLMEKQ